MSEGAKPKLTGIAAVGAAFAAIMMKGGMACGSAISHLAKPAGHVAEDAARAASHIPSGAVKNVEEAGASALVEEAGQAAARRATHMGDTTDRIVDSGTALVRGEARRRAREERENRKEEKKKTDLATQGGAKK